MTPRQCRAASAYRVSVVRGSEPRRGRLHRRRAIELELDADIIHVAQSGERRQLVEIVQAEPYQPLHVRHVERDPDAASIDDIEITSA